MTEAERIADLERRVAELERRAVPVWQTVTARGCTCPAGAEATCRGLTCPRRQWRLGAGSGGSSYDPR